MCFLKCPLRFGLAHIVNCTPPCLQCACDQKLLNPASAGKVYRASEDAHLTGSERESLMPYHTAYAERHIYLLTISKAVLWKRYRRSLPLRCARAVIVIIIIIIAICLETIWHVQRSGANFGHHNVTPSCSPPSSPTLSPPCPTPPYARPPCCLHTRRPLHQPWATVDALRFPHRVPDVERRVQPGRGRPTVRCGLIVPFFLFFFFSFLLLSSFWGKRWGGGGVSGICVVQVLRYCPQLRAVRDRQRHSFLLLVPLSLVLVSV